MGPQRAFWIAILTYGVLSAATTLASARAGDPASVGGSIGGLLVVVAAGYALVRPDRAGGPEAWNVTTLAAVAGAVLYAVVTAAKVL
jgi:hypothetical protein